MVQENLPFQVQHSFYMRLKQKDIHEPFFKVILTRIQTAQNRLKSDMMSCSDSKPKPCELFVLNSETSREHARYVQYS